MTSVALSSNAVCDPVFDQGIDTSGAQARLNSFTETDRRQLAKMVIRLFERWKLSTADQLELLGLSANSRRMLTQYKNGKAFPTSRDLLDRIGWLLVIHQDLRTLYPENPALCYAWIQLRNRHLGNLTPLETMKEQGMIGLFRVAQLLENLVER